MHLPCGRCIGCKLERSKQWAIRLMHEAQLHEANSFLNLTYDDKKRERQDGGASSPPNPTESLRDSSSPSTVKSQTSRDNRDQEPRDPSAREDAHAKRAHEQSLHVRHVQLFLKRLRKDQEKRGLAKIRYYAAGEYGDKRSRPHYHIALFGEEFSEDRYHWRTTEAGHKLYRSPRLEALWTHGNCEIGNLTFESAAYIARYVTKKMTGPKAEEHYKRRDQVTGEEFMVTPEFSIMSRGGKRGKGLGGSWLEKFVTDVYPHDYVVMNGQQLKPPRFYDKHYEAMEPQIMAHIKLERELEGATNAGDNTPERLRSKETVATARLNLKRR